MLKRLFTTVRSKLKSRFDSDLFTYEQLRDMFIPLLLDQVFIFGIGLLSSAMVSSSGNGAISAVNDAFVVSNLAYTLFSSIAMGAGIVIARAKGASDEERIRRTIGQSCVLCTLSGAAIGLLLFTSGAQIVGLLYSKADAEVIAAAGECLSIMGLSIIPYALFNGIFTAFRSLGDTKSSLALTLVINTVHLLCSLLYINVWKLGVAGSAYSYLTARVIGLGFALYWLLRPACSIRLRPKHIAQLDTGIFRDIMALGGPLSLEQVLSQGGMLLVQMYIATLPRLQTDAHGVANSAFMLFTVFGFSIMTITATVCGQCVGAKDIAQAKRYCKSFIWAGRWILLCAILVIMPLMPLVLKLYSPQPEALRFIYIALCLGALPMPLVYPDAYAVASCTRAAGDASYTTMVSLSTLFIGRLALGYLFTVRLGLGMPGVWLGQLAEWIIRAVWLGFRFRGNDWVKVKIP